jgi:hypothetical protein
MTAVWISRFLQSKNLKLKNGMAVVFPGVSLRETPNANRTAICERKG